MLRREGHIGEDVGLGRAHQGGELGDCRLELIGDPAPLLTGICGMVLGEGGGDAGRGDAPPGAAGTGERVPHEVSPTALSGCGQHRRDGRLDALMAVKDDQLDAAKAAPRQLAQERGPEGLGLGRADIHTQDVAPSVAVDADSDDDRHRDDPSGLAHLHLGRVDPETGPVILDETIKEGFCALVDSLAEPRHLALGNAAHDHRLDQVVDRAGRMPWM
jgi:hypothetical protein